MDANKIWSQTMALLKDEVSEVKYKTFFQPVTPAFANNDILILTTPDAFSQEQITPIYLDSVLQ